MEAQTVVMEKDPPDILVAKAKVLPPDISENLMEHSMQEVVEEELLKV